ncbi:MAG: YihA family ribosome biogenesis GTP-binding protein [Bacteroidetes bacterium]|uniref:Probable GTP-binding protein EngB n=1 Tax=Phaeocystidibacter marisrubri TaxID=1577780 RepID=A0A6L3ZFN0_9FLAO|nr:ribosome biogenesis GTP-binding protein YihA/YsxC [Phaeocystidibacter marisrubri]KAB2816842.1 YihA family ribosome biogenesis GTP-binding protein [Phaeocystidibacter marisrubri]TNE29677.1 MAG: YihA family ribosome biogenesis GTP-binding protein [Bacteroidota bacterium]GGH77917.1 putative GTP-binding protein EngB [Phaeocystidibacter marisrubri]
MSESPFVIRKAEFVVSSPRADMCPKADRPEFAFIGRSNVGKSSLINMLVDHKDLAKTSGRPGKTQLINHFNVNDEWYLVDLPGYGYAQVSKTDRKKFAGMIHHYVTGRSNLVNLFVLIDCRHEPQKLDLEFMEMLGEEGVPFSMVFTKLDKLSSTQLQKNLAAYSKKMLNRWEELPPQFRTSASSKIGRMEILQYINTLVDQTKNLFIGGGE